jgi:nicotinamide-nucleotide amidase
LKTYLLTIGDELLIGQITDTNAAWIGQQLQLNGHIVMGKMTVGDEITDIQAALEAALSKADLVLITGGLGATKDDVTKKALCTFFGTELVFDDVTFSRLERFLLNQAGPSAK